MAKKFVKSVPNSRRDWEDPEIPEGTAREMAEMHPAEQVLPSVVAAFRGGQLKRAPGQRGAQKSATKLPVSIRLSADVVAYFKATGRGWQTRIDDALRKYVDSRK